MFKAAKTVDFLFLTYYTDDSKQRKRLSSLIRLYFPLYLSRRSVSFSALRTERPINFLCRRRAAEWMIVMEKFDSLIIGEVAQDTNVDFDGTVVQAVGGAVYYSGCAAANMGHKIAGPAQGGPQPAGRDGSLPRRRLPPSSVYPPEQPPLLCDEKRLPHGGPGAPDLHRGQRHRPLHHRRGAGGSD